MNKVISISFIHSLNIIYQINKLILPSVRILLYIRHEITRGVNMYISAGFVFTLIGKTYSSSSPVLS